MAETTKISTCDWKAWIDIMPGIPKPGQPGRGATLHVVGKVDTYNADLAYLEPRSPQGINPKILMLDLHVVTGIVPVDNPQRVHYTQPVGSKDAYTSIDIFYEGQHEATIDTVEAAH